MLCNAGSSQRVDKNIISITVLLLLHKCASKGQTCLNFWTLLLTEADRFQTACYDYNGGFFPFLSTPVRTRSRFRAKNRWYHHTPVLSHTLLKMELKQVGKIFLRWQISKRLLTYFLVSFLISRSSSSLSFSTKLSKTGISNFIYWAT